MFAESDVEFPVAAYAQCGSLPQSRSLSGHELIVRKTDKPMDAQPMLVAKGRDLESVQASLDRSIGSLRFTSGSNGAKTIPLFFSGDTTK